MAYRVVAPCIDLHGQARACLPGDQITGQSNAPVYTTNIVFSFKKNTPFTIGTGGEGGATAQTSISVADISSGSD